MRQAAFGGPVPPPVNVTSAGESGAHASMYSNAGISCARRHGVAPGIPAATTICTGILRIAREIRRSRCALGPPKNALGGHAAQQRSIAVNPPDGSMTIATRPSLKIASSAT